MSLDPIDFELKLHRLTLVLDGLESALAPSSNRPEAVDISRAGLSALLGLLRRETEELYRDWQRQRAA